MADHQRFFRWMGWSGVLLTAGIFLYAQGAAAQAVSAAAGGKTQRSSIPAPEEPGLGEIVKSGVEWFVSLAQPGDPETSDEPQWTTYRSPRDVVMTFTEAMRDVRLGRTEAWPRALGAFGDDADSADARSQAEALFSVFERFGEIEPQDLPGEEVLQKNDFSRYQVFPYGIEHVWVWEALEDAPVGQIVVAQNAAGQWQFTAETTAGAEELFQSMRALPPRYEERDVGDVFLGAIEPFRRTPLQSWMVFFASVLGGVLVAVACSWALTRASRKLDKHDHEYAGAFVGSISFPVALVVFVVAFAFGLGFVRFPPALDDLRWGLLRLLIVVAAGAFVFKLVDLLAVGLKQLAGVRGTRYDETTALLLRRSLRTVTFILLAIFILQNLVGVNVSALLAGVGILGIALSLAGQGIFKNALGGINIFINQPFLVGDWIQFDDHWGEVVDVGLYATKVRLLSGEIMTVPNMRFIDETVQNLDERRYLRRTMDIAITYDTPPAKVEEAVDTVRGVLESEEVVRVGKCNLEERPPQVSFSHYGPYFLNIRAYYWYFIEDGETLQRDSERGWYSYLQHCSLVNLKIKEAFDEARIEFAFPTETHFLATDPDRGLDVAWEDGAENGREKAAGKGAEVSGNE